MTTQRVVARRATLDDARALMDALGPIRRASGYAIGLYGSVLSGEGADIDLIATPFPKHDAQLLLSGLSAFGQLRVLKFTPSDGFLPVEIILPSGVSVDLHVHR